MRRIFAAMLVLLGCLFSFSVPASAQLKQDAVDGDHLAAAVLAIAPEELLAALEAAPDDDLLPAEFSAPVDGEPRNAPMVEAFGSIGSMPGTFGSVIHGIDTDPTQVPGVMSTGIITYAVGETAVPDDVLDSLEATLSGRLDDPALAMGEVEQVELDGTKALLGHFVFEQGQAVMTVQLLVIPAGNVLTVAVVASVDTGSIAAEDLLPLTEGLALAGVAHLAAVVGA